MFGASGSTTVVNKRLSFLSIAILSLASVLIVTILTTAGVGVYALAVIDTKTDGLLSLVKEGIKSLPALRSALPPALADGFDDERSPQYREQVDARAWMPENGDTRWRGGRTIVEVKNRGDRTVTLMSLRLVGLDGQGDPVAERTTWGATPLQLEGEWRGPILPRQTRQFAVWSMGAPEIKEVNCEITDLRVWKEKSPGTDVDGPTADEPDTEDRSAT